VNTPHEWRGARPHIGRPIVGRASHVGEGRVSHTRQARVTPVATGPTPCRWERGGTCKRDMKTKVVRYDGSCGPISPFPGRHDSIPRRNLVRSFRRRIAAGSVDEDGLRDSGVRQRSGCRQGRGPSGM
jgi:hypothetical protein